MVSWIGKSLLVATSLAPVCGAFAVTRLSELDGGIWYRDFDFWKWTGIAFGLVAITYGFLRWCQEHLKNSMVRTQTIKPTDKDVLAFLLAYLLPLLGQDSLSFHKPIIAVYVILLISVAVYHSNSYHFNPMLSLFGFHFYEIQTTDGYSAMLISRRAHVLQEQGVIVVKITDFLLLEIVPPQCLPNENTEEQNGRQIPN